MARLLLVADVRCLQRVLDSAEKQWKKNNHEVKFLNNVSLQNDAILSLHASCCMTFEVVNCIYQKKASKLRPRFNCCLD